MSDFATKRARRRIAILFVTLSTLLYAVMATATTIGFKLLIDQTSDRQLRVLCSELGHAIEDTDDGPHFRNWFRETQIEPQRSMISIQIFNRHHRLIERYGLPAGPKAFLDTRGGTIEKNGYRITSTPILKGRIIEDQDDDHDQDEDSAGSLIGHLQLGMPTAERDRILHLLLTVIFLLAPILLIGLGFLAYYISDIATAPMARALAILKQFVADASHELNSPLAIAQANLEILQQKCDLPEAEHNRIDRALERMRNMTQDMLLLAELETDKNRSLVQSETNWRLDDLLGEMLEDFEERFAQKQIALAVTQNEPIVLNAPVDAVQRIVANLLENALRYTDSGGKVELSSARLEEMPGFARVTITDTGIGIAADHLPHLFDRFYRADQSRSRASGGTGLGLAIVQGLSARIGAQISVESKIGQGSAFSLVLPIDDKLSRPTQMLHN